MSLLDLLKVSPSGIKAAAGKGVQYLKENMSVTDQFRALSKDDLLTDTLLPSVHLGNTDSAVSHANSARLQGDLELNNFHVLLDRVSGMTGINRANVKQGIPIRAAVQQKAAEYLYAAHRAELDGLPELPLPKEKEVQDLIKVYHESKFAENSWQRQADAGIESIKSVPQSKNYVPVQHDSHKVFRRINGDEKNFKAIARAYGDQLAAQFPQMLKTFTKAGDTVEDTYERLGTQFLNNMKRRMQQTNGNVEGTTKEQLTDLLRAAGIEDDVIENTLRNLQPSMEKAGESKHLRHRIGWDVNKAYPMPDGSTFRIIDGLNTNLEQVLKTYNNGISARVGLAKKGITNHGELTAQFNKILDKYAGDPVKHAHAKQFLDNTKNLLLGKPVGEVESNLLQAAGIAGRALHLKNSGLFNMLDYATTIREFGFKTVMQHFRKGFKEVIQKEDLTPVQAQKVTDIIKCRLINEGKLRSVYTHMDNNFQTDGSLFMTAMHTAGQSVRFLNGSEFVRRHHIGMIASIQGDILEGLPKGSTKAVEYLKGLGMSDARIAELKSAIDQHGLYDSLWPVDLADEVAARLTSSVDTMALQVRKGETPAFLTYSNVGRVLFPYFTFVAASHNKLLRRELHRNGATGVALHMVSTAPLAMMVAVMNNISSNKDPFEDVVTKAMSSLPALGYFSAPMNFGLRGEFGGTPVPFAVLNSVPGFMDGLSEGSVDKMVKNSPLLAVTFPVRLAVGAVSEDN